MAGAPPGCAGGGIRPRYPDFKLSDNVSVTAARGPEAERPALYVFPGSRAGSCRPAGPTRAPRRAARGRAGAGDGGRGPALGPFGEANARAIVRFWIEQDRAAHPAAAGRAQTRLWRATRRSAGGTDRGGATRRRRAVRQALVIYMPGVVRSLYPSLTL